jgi:D-xylose transport system permease protein
VDDSTSDRASASESQPAPAAAALAGQSATASADVLVDSLGEYVAVWWQRLRGGESGALPILAGLVIIVIIFQSQQSKFLSSGNLVNLLVQAAFFILLGLAEMFALILSEIDLSVGFVAAIGGTIIAALISPPYDWPWWAGVIIGLLASGFLGAVQGTLITRLHLPSFVVTLAGLLGFSGLLIYIFDVDSGSVGGVISISNNKVVYNLVNGNMSPTASWIVLAVAVAIFAAVSINRTRSRRARGLSAPPMSITVLTILVAAGAGILLVIVCNVNRGSLIPLQGVPWVVPLVLAIVVAWSWLLGKTRTGRYIYAIGGSPEAARRAGVNVALIRTIAFALSGFTAGIAGLVYASRLGSISVGFDGGTYVLYAVAAAVIGGASLFGGRGKAVHALLGGIVIAAVYNGLALLGISTAGTEMATALVLLAAVSVDSLVRRRGTSAA